MSDMLCQLCHRRPVGAGAPLLDPRTFKDVYVCDRCRIIGATSSHDPAASSRLDYMDDMDWYVWFDSLAARMYQKTPEFKARQREHIEKRMKGEQHVETTAAID